MTTICSKTVQCAACGIESEHTEIASTNQMGYADTDSRPPEMMRSTMFAWVQRCPECGYCYSDISESVGSEQQVVASSEYQDILRSSEQDGLAALFNCQSLIDERAGQYAKSAWAAIHAAWVFDDLSDRESATSARDRALSMISNAVDGGQEFVEGAANECAIVVDLLRRAGHLREAKARVDQLDCAGVDDVFRQVLDFQVQLIQDRDTDCHTIGEALARE